MFKKISSSSLFIFSCLSFWLFTPTAVLAQSQNDMTPGMEFDGSTINHNYLLLNYNCTNIPWPGQYAQSTEEKAYDTYRRISSSSVDEKNCLIYLNGENKGQIVKNSEGNPLACIDTFWLYSNYKGTEGRETVLDIERGIKQNVDDFYNNHKVTRPIVFSKDDTQITYFDIIDKTDKTVDIPSEYHGLAGSPVCVYRETKAAENEYVTQMVLANFIPPTFQQIENYSTILIYWLWSLVFLYSFVRLIMIGFNYLYSGYSPERLGEVNSKLALWFFGLVLIFLAIPFLNFLYSLIGISNSECFQHPEITKAKDPASNLTDQQRDEILNNPMLYNLTAPGFTLFFEDVCTGEYAVN